MTGVIPGSKDAFTLQPTKIEVAVNGRGLVQDVDAFQEVKGGSFVFLDTYNVLFWLLPCNFWQA